MDHFIKICREAFLGFFGKPMANYFSCRLESPVEGASYAYKNCAGKHAGKCISHVYMKKPGDDSTVLQALRYKKAEWSRSEAKSHCSKQKDGKGGKFE